MAKAGHPDAVFVREEEGFPHHGVVQDHMVGLNYSQAGVTFGQRRLMLRFRKAEGGLTQHAHALRKLPGQCAFSEAKPKGVQFCGW